MTNRRFFAALAFCFALLLAPFFRAPAADVYMGLQAFGSGGKALSLGLAPFTAVTGGIEGADLAQKLRSVLREDLLFARYFTVVEGAPAPQKERLDSLAWGALGAQVVISGEVRSAGQDILFECKVYDVGSGKAIFDKQGQAPASGGRRLAHFLADQLVFQLTGQPGIAHTRIAFINNRTRSKELYVMDYDGANIEQLTRDHSIALLPKWSPDGKAIAFNSYREGNPDAYLLDYPGRELHPLSMRQGLNTAPGWSPDGAQLAVTLSRGGDPELYLINRAGRIVRRLTYSQGVDTSPSFSPNGQQIAFISDRSGNPELYVMDAAGANLQRLTYGQWLDAPAWSPRGGAIAYERQRLQDQYNIYLIDPSGGNNQALTEDAGRNESPSWSPDGRFLAFTSTRDGRQRVYVMGADGSAPHPVGDLPGNSFDPSWGP